MSDQTPPDWTNWIIGTIMTALGSAVGAVVALAKMIETKYVTEIKLLRDETVLQKTEMDNMKKKHEECMEAHYQAEIRFKVLEAQVAGNTRDSHHG